jgi:hypothetical protein
MLPTPNSFVDNFRLAKDEKRPNKACTRLVGFAPPKRSKLRSYQFRQINLSSSHPPAGNVYRSAASISFETMLILDMSHSKEQKFHGR